MRQRKQQLEPPGFTSKEIIGKSATKAKEPKLGCCSRESFTKIAGFLSIVMALYTFTSTGGPSLFFGSFARLMGNNGITNTKGSVKSQTRAEKETPFLSPPLKLPSLPNKIIPNEVVKVSLKGALPPGKQPVPPKQPNGALPPPKEPHIVNAANLKGAPMKLPSSRHGNVRVSIHRKGQ